MSRQYDRRLELHSGKKVENTVMVVGVRRCRRPTSQRLSSMRETLCRSLEQ
jgi:hypothetical protein